MAMAFKFRIMSFEKWHRKLKTLMSLSAYPVQSLQKESEKSQATRELLF
jgi:hypothetical protein